MTAAVLYQVDDGVAVITLNRPEAMNAFSPEMGELWSQYYRQADNDDAVRAIVVTANGPAWCAGADMSGGGATFDSAEKSTDNNLFSSCPVELAFKLRKPVIAAMTGHAVGVGFSLAMQCDFRVCAADAKYGLIQPRRGVLADGVMHWLLPRLIGVEKALRVVLLGEKFTGTQLCEMGLALKAVPGEHVFDEAMALARVLADEPAPLVTALAKKLVWDGLDQTAEQMEQEETRVMHFTMGKADAIEGGMAFAERRKPVWKDSVSRLWPEAHPDKNEEQ